MAFFRAQGFEVAFWLGRSIGHTELPTDRKRWPFQPIVGPTGAEVPGCFCPLDRRFRRYLAHGLAIIAQSGVDFILIDDDYRMQNHGANARLAPADVAARLTSPRASLASERGVVRLQTLAVRARGGRWGGAVSRRAQ